MKQNGWQFDFSYDGSTSSDLYKNVITVCGSQAKWYGWSSHTLFGTLSATLQGKGQITLDLGNCGDSGTVNVYLDTNLIASVPAETRSVVTAFSFTSGSVLNVKDENGDSVISLNSINFNCDGMISCFCK